MIAVTTATASGAGRTAAPIRRSETSRACAFSAAVAVDRGRDGRVMSLSKEHSCLVEIAEVTSS